MMRFYNLIILFIFIPLVSIASINLNKYRLRHSNITYKYFTRDQQLRYRGVGPELTPPQAIKAMLGDEAAGMKSMFTEGIRYQLQGQTAPFQAHLTRYFTSNVIQMIKSAIEENDGEYYNYRKACIKAYEIAEQNFKSKYTDSAVRSYFLDYNSLIYYDYPNDPREVVFTTAYMEIAANYSSHIAVIDEKEEKSIDLNYYNFVKNGKWIRKVKPWPDKGEFITANYVPAEDITGYEIRRNFTLNFELFSHPGNNLYIAFYKVIEDGVPYVLIIDGNNQVGIHKDHYNFTYAVSNINPNEAVPSNIQSNGNEVEVLGIIKLCSTDEPCSSPSHLLRKYNVEPRKGFYDYYQKQIERIRIGNKQAKIFFHDHEIPKDYNTSYIPPAPKEPESEEEAEEVVEEAEEAEEEAEEAEEEEEDDKLNIELAKARSAIDLAYDEHLNVIDHLSPTKEEEKSLEYNLHRSQSMNSGDAIYFAIPKKYQDLEIKKVEIDHFKLQADDYATMSIQFFHNDDNNWKTSGNLDYKGRLDSPVGLSPQTETLLGWEKDEFRTFARRAKLDSILKSQTARIMSIGRKNNFLKRFKIIFKEAAK